MSRLKRRLRHVRDTAANALNRSKISEIRSSIGQLIANAGKGGFCTVRLPVLANSPMRSHCWPWAPTPARDLPASERRSAHAHFARQLKLTLINAPTAKKHIVFR